MGKPHKHAELIKAWADGAEIQYYSNLSNKWEDIIHNPPTWANSALYRIKPKTVRYRLYLTDVRDSSFRVGIANPTNDIYGIEHAPGFIKWISDWQEVEI